VVNKFQCQLQLLELLDHKSIFTAGYTCILHIHSITEECEVLHLDYELDKKTKARKKCKFAKSNAAVSCRIGLDKGICVETFEQNPQMGRFTLRDEGKTIAIGKITKLPPPST
jgi:peptide chain release factor subunit 3